MEFRVLVKSVYGNELVYPVNLTATLFAKLLGVKTFNRPQLSTIKALGYEITVKGNDRLPFEA